MRYLGGMSGTGVLKCNGEEIARATYDFDGFFKERVGVTSSGEIGADAETLRGVFGRKDIQLLTDDGRLLNLTFSAKDLSPESQVAHVDVSGQLPSASQTWRH